MLACVQRIRRIASWKQPQKAHGRGQHLPMSSRREGTFAAQGDLSVSAQVLWTRIWELILQHHPFAGANPISVVKELSCYSIKRKAPTSTLAFRPGWRMRRLFLFNQDGFEVISSDISP